MLVLLTFLWGSNWIAMKLALQRADAIVFNAERTVVAVVSLFAWMLATRTLARPRRWGGLLVVALFQTVLNFGGTTLAVAGGGAGRASVLAFTMPFWTLLIAAPVLGERVKRDQWLALAFALAGLTLVVEPWNWHGELAARGWGVLSGLAWAAGSVAIKKLQPESGLDITNFIGWQMAIGAVPLVLLALATGHPMAAWTPGYAMLLVYVGTLSTALGFLLWSMILRWLPAGRASMSMYAIPVIAMLLSMLVFGEMPGPVAWAGIGLLAVGLAIIAAGNLRAASWARSA